MGESLGIGAAIRRRWAAVNAEIIAWVIFASRNGP
jgi:hypothetical protein